MTDVGKAATSAAGGAARRTTGAARDTAEKAGTTARDTGAAAGATIGLGAGFDRLKGEAMNYLGARAQKALSGFTGQLGGLTEQLNGGGDGQGEGHSDGGGGMLLEGGKRMLQGQSPLRAFAGAGGKSAKDKVSGMFKKLGGGGSSSGGPKVINIIEDIDVGVPVREAYDQWTQYKEFGNFAKGVQSVDKADDVTTNWKGKIFWSNRSWQGKVSEQIPDQRIVWSSDGAKGTNKGVITFHPLGDNLTKVLLVVEYYPKGFFEKTANIWRAQGRRLRLDLKHYRRFIMMRGEATDAWRGEIRDGEVVRDHDEVVEEEERQAAEEGAVDEGEPVDEEDAAGEDEAEEPEDELAEEEAAEGEEEEPAEDEYAEEDELPEEEPAESAYEEPAEDEEEPEPAEDEYEEEPERTRG